MRKINQNFVEAEQEAAGHRSGSPLKQSQERSPRRKFHCKPLANMKFS